MERAVSFAALCPVVREVGLQRGDFWQIPRRIYDHQLMLCISGSVDMTIAANAYHLRQGHLAIIPPDTPHTLVNSDPATELVWIHFDFLPEADGDWIYRWYNTPENYIHCFSDRLPHPEHIRPIPVFPGNYRLPYVAAFDEASEWIQQFQSLANAYLQEQNHFTVLARIAVLQILNEVMEWDGYWQHSGPIRVSDLVIQYIKTNYMNRITIQDICVCTQYNPDYTGRLFRKETGSTIVDYLNRYRINRARTLLLDESLSVAAIAEKCGFQSVNYFSRVTHKLTGKSPRELRTSLLSMKNNTNSNKGEI